ncbi:MULTISPECIES: molybdopterin cofactor-binding domain-containing protein [Derxia]|uniref:Molybdopterin cofactor-binding domain-containing protein n=1 Tax=Derxia gummosa DSM 723 TaxID=1121388 RepID=A0A9U5GFY4_9BURK|nr:MULTISPECIES: molybdopterin cofactor-binding domain-containing protein [Derxia]
MKPFAFRRAATPDEALAQATDGFARYIAGGTNLLDLMKLEIEAPATMVDINRLALDRIQPLPGGGLRIGALARNADLAADGLVREHWPLLSRALLSGASAQIRNRATTAGNLLQRTRCNYFYDPAQPCNKREPGSGCGAMEGFNRMNAILGGSPSCIAVHPSDMAVALRVLDAEIETLTRDGRRRSIPLGQFHRLPGDTPHIETALEEGELVTGVLLPPAPVGSQHYVKVRDRASYAFALVSIAAVVDVADGRIRAARLAFGGIAPKPWRDPDVEALLSGAPASDATFADAARLLLRNARGHGHNDFKIPLLERTFEALLHDACGLSHTNGHDPHAPTPADLRLAQPDRGSEPVVVRADGSAADAPAGPIGQPLPRVEGRLKVTGQARYAHEVRDLAAPMQVTAPSTGAATAQGVAPVPSAAAQGGSRAHAHGVIVGATAARGRITQLDTRVAETLPGVLLVLTHRNMPRQGRPDDGAAPQMTSDRIDQYDQPVALVVADSLEAASAAARRIEVTIEPDLSGARYDIEAAREAAVTPKAMIRPPESIVGNLDRAMREAPFTLDATWTTPHQSHAAMEPHAAVADWDGDALTVHCANQMVQRAPKILAATFGLPEAKVHCISSFIGGGFGGKLEVRAETVLATAAALALKRPVRVMQTRQQVFHNTSHRSATVQRIRLAADESGVLSGLGHEVLASNRPGAHFYEMAADQTRSLYAAAHRRTTHRLAPLDLPESASMRAPGEAVGLLAIEGAMDELAEMLGLDPIELRIRNEPEVDPESGAPFSTRRLVDCMLHGARRFGWADRPLTPANRREGRLWIGTGMAAAIRGNLLQPASARVRLDEAGATVETSMTDIGTGSYTVLAQIAAETLGLPVERITVRLGDSRLPAGPGSGGSWGANSSGMAVRLACEKLRDKLAGTGERTGSASADFKPGDELKTYSQYSYGAHFAEVSVDDATGEVRVRRMLGVFEAGRLLNARTARSQALGGMIFGIGSALMEELAVDAKRGFFVNHDLANYHVPAHADVPALEVEFLESFDDKANALGGKGLGELGISGAGAAIANAVWHACGVRVRDYPITPDKLMR